MDGRRFFRWRMVGALALCIAAGCERGPDRVGPDRNYPHNVRMVIDGDSAATRDTVMRVNISGENIDIMSISASPDFSGADWEQFDTLAILNSPRVEGFFSAYGRFASAGGGTTDVIRDDIYLDLSASIRDFVVSAPDDTLHPGEVMEFAVDAGETGRAEVSLGRFISGFLLNEYQAGRFRGSLVIPVGIRESRARVVAGFTDAVGNTALPVVWSDVFEIAGRTLSLALVQQIDIPGAEGADVFVSNGYAFLSDWNGFVHVINATAPVSADLAASLVMPDWPYGIDGNESFLYVANGEAGVVVLDIADPAAAERAATVALSGMPRDVVLWGAYACVACVFSSFQVLDITFGGSPQGVASLNLSTYGRSVRTLGNTAFVTGEWGAAIVDLTFPQNPVLVSEFPIEGVPLALAGYAGYMFVATEFQGLKVYDVHRLIDPKLVGTFLEGYHISSLLPEFPFLYVGTNRGVMALNMSRPDSLYLESSVETGRQVRGMFAYGSYLYTADTGGLSVISLFRD